MTGLQKFICDAIIEERRRQDEKFGQMPRDRAPSVHLAILMEEVGEVAKAILEGDSDGYLEELVQVAAVAIAAIEDYHVGKAKYEIPGVCKPIRYVKEQEPQDIAIKELAQSFDKFCRENPDAIRQYDGKYILFEDDCIADSGESRVEVAMKAYQNGGMRPLFIEKISLSDTNT